MVEAERLEIGHVAMQDVAQGIAVQEADVIALVERIDDDLPVHGLRDQAPVVERPGRKSERSEFVGEPAKPWIDIEIRRTVRGRDHPYQTVLFTQRQFDERSAVAAHVGKAALVGDAHQLT